MSLEINNAPIGDVRAINAVSNSKQNASGPLRVEEEEAYSVSKSGDKPSQFKVDYDKISSLKADYRKGYRRISPYGVYAAAQAGPEIPGCFEKDFRGKRKF